MNAKRFDELIAQTRLGQKHNGEWGKEPKAIQAARLHLVKGLGVSEAARRVGGVSNSAVYALLAKVPRETCPHCGAVVRADQSRKLSGSIK